MCKMHFTAIINERTKKRLQIIAISNTRWSPTVVFFKHMPSSVFDTAPCNSTIKMREKKIIKVMTQACIEASTHCDFA